MIDVNIWYASILGKKIEKGIIGPMLASASNGNVGHASLGLSITSRSAAYKKIKKHARELNAEKVFSYVPKSLQDSQNICYERERVESYTLSFSFWPGDEEENSQKTSAVRDAFHLLLHAPKSKGVKSALSNYETDMIREDTGKRSYLIQHSFYKKEKEKIHSEKKNNLNTAIAASELECDLENKKSIAEQLQNFKNKLETAINKQKELEEKYHTEQQTLAQEITSINKLVNKKDSELKFISKKLNYLNKISDPDPRTRRDQKNTNDQVNNLGKLIKQSKDQLAELQSKCELLQQAYNEQLENSQLEIEELNYKIAFEQNQYEELNKKLDGKNSQTLQLTKRQHKKKADSLTRHESQLGKFYRTEGEAPDHTISLPTSDSGLRFYVDEAAVLDAIQREKQKNYSFILNNCAKSSKACLLAGIQHLRADLIANGVPNKFFKLNKLENCENFKKWVTKLHNELIKLNVSYNVSEEYEQIKPMAAMCG